MTVSGPPQNARSTSPTCRDRGETALSGTISMSPSTRWRNGICTSTACSCACVGSLTMSAGAGAPGTAVMRSGDGVWEQRRRNRQRREGPFRDSGAQSPTHGFGGHIHRNRAKRGAERVIGGAGDAANGDTMGRADDDRATDRAAARCQQRIGERRRGAGVDVAGMRHDDGLRPLAYGRFRPSRHGHGGSGQAIALATGRTAQQRARVGELGVDHVGEFVRIGRIERASHGGRTRIAERTTQL